MKYYGKYRAIVTDTNDPEKRGRVKVTCPKVYGSSKSPWCQPCVPYAYDNGGDFVLPKLNDFVWIEFEEGDVQYPIYVGGLWAKNKSPLSDYTKAVYTRQLEFLGCKVTMSYDPDTSIKTVVITNGSATVRLQGGTVYVNGTPVP